MIYNETLNTISSNDYYVSCTPYIVFLTSVIIGGVFLYFCWRSEKEDSVCRVKFNPGKQTTVY